MTTNVNKKAVTWIHDLHFHDSTFLRIARLAIEDQVRKDPIIQESRAKIANEGHPALQLIGRTESNIIDLKHRHESASDGEEKAKQVNEFDFGGSSNGVEDKNDGDRVIALVFVDIEFELHLHGWLSCIREEKAKRT